MMMRRLSLASILLLAGLCWGEPAVPETAPAASPPSETGPATTPAKIPVPDTAAQREAVKLLNEVYETDFANAVTPIRRTALARKLLAAVPQETTSPVRFVLLTRARDLAVEGADLDLALASIAELDQAYTIDALAMSAEAATGVAKVARSPEQRRRLAEGAGAIADRALAADRYSAARALAELALGVSRATSDPELQRSAAQRARQIREMETAYADIKKSLDMLAAQPADPAANLGVGRFRCFFTNDWPGGLSLLARGGDKILAPLAQQELAGATEPAAQVALGDGWGAVAEKERDPAKNNVQQHACQWYRLAEPNLSGLTKARIQGRLKALAGTEPASKTVNLLKLVDLSKHVIAGKWALSQGNLTVESGWFCRLEFPYRPPAEYDYRVAFTRTAGNDSIAPICAVGSHQFVLDTAGWGSTIFSFSIIDGRMGNNNATVRKAVRWIENGRPYTALVKVRREGVQGWLNGKLVTEWKTNYKEMSLFATWGLRHNDVLGLGANSAATTFRTVEVTEISGHGEIVKDAEPQ